MHNTRRNSYNGPQSNAVGQRRNHITNNFVPGGKLHPQGSPQMNSPARHQLNRQQPYPQQGPQRQIPTRQQVNKQQHQAHQPPQQQTPQKTLPPTQAATPQKPQATPQKPQATPQKPQATPQKPQVTPAPTPQKPQATPAPTPQKPQAAPAATPQKPQVTPAPTLQKPQAAPAPIPQNPQATPAAILQKPQTIPAATPQKPQATPAPTPQKPQATLAATPQKPQATAAQAPQKPVQPPTPVVQRPQATTTAATPQKPQPTQVAPKPQATPSPAVQIPPQPAVQKAAIPQVVQAVEKPQPAPIQTPQKPIIPPVLAPQIPPPIPMLYDVKKMEVIPQAEEFVTKIEIDEEETSMEVTDVDEFNEDSPKKKMPIWKMKPKGKVSKHDKIKKRNHRLRKIIQPKNASMVLNELVGGLATQVNDVVPCFNTDKAFRATIVYDSVEHEGFGKSKAVAKSAAAEAVIKYLFMKRVKKVPSLNSLAVPQTSGVVDITANAVQPEVPEFIESEADMKMEEGDVKMMEDEEDTLFSWSHIASFAIHKLLTTWDDGTIMNTISGAGSVERAPSLTSNTSFKAEKPEPNPAKKMPENACNMNPLMLLHQMQPNTTFQEISKVGKPPNIEFSVKCTVGGKDFIGYGPSKKAARKLAAYLACQTVLEIEYPSETLQLIEVAKAK